jgi:hypothetical protein
MVVVVPVLHFPGNVLDSIHRQLQEARAVVFNELEYGTYDRHQYGIYQRLFHFHDDIYNNHRNDYADPLDAVHAIWHAEEPIQSRDVRDHDLQAGNNSGCQPAPAEQQQHQQWSVLA